MTTPSPHVVGTVDVAHHDMPHHSIQMGNVPRLVMNGTSGSNVTGVQTVVPSVVVPSECQQNVPVEARGWRMARGVGSGLLAIGKSGCKCELEGNVNLCLRRIVK